MFDRGRCVSSERGRVALAGAEVSALALGGLWFCGVTHVWHALSGMSPYLLYHMDGILKSWGAMDSVGHMYIGVQYV